MFSQSTCSFIPLSSLPDPIICNKILKKEVLDGRPKQAILTYISMQKNGFNADNFTFPILLKVVGSNWLSYCDFGLAIHGQTIKTGFYDHVFVQTAMLNMYSSIHRIDGACKVFENMPVRDLVAWNSMLDAYASCGQMDDAMKVFDSMPYKDNLSFNTMISGFGCIGKVASARNMFDKMPVRDTVSWNSMILACANVRNMEEARKLFESMPKKSVVTWNTMITGYSASKLYSDAIDLFIEMKDKNVEPTYITVAGALSACAHSGSLEKGIEIHIYAQHFGLASSSLHVTTSLIDMYSKCGRIQSALEVFYKAPVKDIYCWNALISGLALHGYGSAALKLFNKMKENGITPDDITFIGLLSACSHSGLVQEGCQIFNSIENDYGITPKLEHYGCMVDLLARASFLDRAFQLIEAMPFQPEKTILGALLSACVSHRDVKNGEKVIKLMYAKDHPIMTDGEYMMLANLYAACGQWEESEKWRDMMNNNDARIVKTAGCSVIEVDGRSFKYLAGDVSMAD